MKLLERNKDLNVVFVGGEYSGQIMKVKDLINLSEFVGLSEDLTKARNNGGCVKRAELDNLPIIEGYTSMWDGGKIRYETWEVYNSMFD